jgi:hypothetical protein
MNKFKLGDTVYFACIDDGILKLIACSVKEIRLSKSKRISYTLQLTENPENEISIDENDLFHSEKEAIINLQLQLEELSKKL